MKRCRLMLTVTLCLVAAVVSGQDAKQPKKQAAKKKARPNPAMAKVEDVPGLPRVLLIGDSISIGYTAPVREMLKGVANVHRPLTNCGPTTRGGTISVARDQRANAEALAIPPLSGSRRRSSRRPAKSKGISRTGTAFARRLMAATAARPRASSRAVMTKRTGVAR